MSKDAGAGDVLKLLANFRQNTIQGRGHDQTLDMMVAELFGWTQKMNVSGKAGGNLPAPLSASADACMDLAEFRFGTGLDHMVVKLITVPGGVVYQSNVQVVTEPFGVVNGNGNHGERGRAALAAVLQLMSNLIWVDLIVAEAKSLGQTVTGSFWGQYRSELNGSMRSLVNQGDAQHVHDWVRHKFGLAASVKGNA